MKSTDSTATKRRTCAFNGEQNHAKRGGCGKRPLPDDRFCQTHREMFDRFKQEFDEDPNLIFNKRSDTRDKFEDAGKVKKSPRRPTCCYVGCFEYRVPGTPYCDTHSDCGLED